MTTDPESIARGHYGRGYYTAADDLANFINALDTSQMDGKQVRTAIYSKCLEMRPSVAALKEKS